MTQQIADSAFFGTFLSILGYLIGCAVRRKTGLSAANPLLIALILVILTLRLTGVSYETYQNSARYLSWFLTPATVCLGYSLYRQIGLLKKHTAAILTGILAGALSGMASVLLLAKLFRLSHEQYVTLLPKSVTSPIGLGIAEELGGFAQITVAVIILTGLFGNLTAALLCRIFRIDSPVAQGLAVGASSHVIGAARAFEMGEVQGAMCSLSIVLSGLITVLCAGVFSSLYR